MASNPVFDRIEKESRQGYAGFGRSGAPAQQPTGGLAATDAMSSRNSASRLRASSPAT